MTLLNDGGARIKAAETMDCWEDRGDVGRITPSE